MPHGIVPGHRPDRLRQDDDAVFGAQRTQRIGVKIITTEDPIEYDIDGIIQSPVNPDIGVTFAALLRAILRQDPDIDPRRRDPRLRNRPDRRPGVAHRAHGVQHAAHQRRAGRRSRVFATWACSRSSSPRR